MHAGPSGPRWGTGSQLHATPTGLPLSAARIHGMAAMARCTSCFDGNVLQNHEIVNLCLTRSLLDGWGGGSDRRVQRFSLRKRAAVFAVCAGVVAFILALAATADSPLDVPAAGRALIVAIVCGVLCWASAERALAATAGAIDAAIERLAQAAHGDLRAQVPQTVRDRVPPLAAAMDGLFHQMHNNLESIERLALFDAVTALPNRTHFRRASERMLGELPSDALAALFFIDLDRFKAVNDTLGHAAGDMLLSLLAGRLRALADRLASDARLRPPLIGRLAGDEFTMFFPELHHPRDAEPIARAILTALSEPFEIAGQAVEIGASVGIALRPDHGTTLHDLMRAADAAMYRAKLTGRGRAECYSHRIEHELADRARLETELREAVAFDQFALAFQPQIGAADGRIVGAEALLRWKHPSGLRLPGSFLDRAEETGLIIEIGDWVFASAAETIARWGRQGIEQRLAVNVSPRQIDHALFFRRLREALHAARAPARLLELEISETLAMRCSGEVIAAIAALRADGASIAIDDFGTGYTNVARLRGLPVDRIKLHQSLTHEVAAHPQARAVVQAVIGLIHGIGCEAVAEGIETDAQAAVLRVLGCDILQGYAIAPPMEEGAFLAWAADFAPRRMVG